MMQPISFPTRDLIVIGPNVTPMPGPLVAAVAAFNKEPRPGLLSMKAARLAVALRARKKEAEAELAEMILSHTVMRPVLRDGVPVLDADGTPRMEPAPVVRTLAPQADGTARTVEIPGQIQVRDPDGLEATLQAWLASEVSVTVAPFTAAELEALTIAPSVLEALLPFVVDGA
jgi:hypothetical protein